MELDTRVESNTRGTVSFHRPEAIRTNFANSHKVTVLAVANIFVVFTNKGAGRSDLGFVFVRHSQVLVSLSNGQSDEHTQTSRSAVGNLGGIQIVGVVKADEVGESVCSVIDSQGSAGGESIFVVATIRARGTALVNTSQVSVVRNAIGWVDHVVVVITGNDVCDPDVRTTSNIIGEGNDGSVNLFRNEGGVKRKTRVTVEFSCDSSAVADINGSAAVSSWIRVERR